MVCVCVCVLSDIYKVPTTNIMLILVSTSFFFVDSVLLTLLFVFELIVAVSVGLFAALQRPRVVTHGYCVRQVLV